MANNDIYLVDGIIDNMISEKNILIDEHTRGHVFEKFAIEQILKSYDLTQEQITDGLVDGGDDGGIDGFFIFVNGICLSDKSTHIWPKSNAQLEIYIITCKHHSTYELNPLESLDSSLSELFNLSIGTDNLKSKYKKEIIEKRKTLINAYRRLAPVIDEFSIQIKYISRGDSGNVAYNILAKGRKIESTCENLFSECKAEADFLGSKELIQQFRKKRNGLTILKTHKILQQSNNYVVLVTLDNYNKFISDDDGKLKRFYFEENVRDFLGENRTNIDIARTLNRTDCPDFWLLNNGITILVSSAVALDGQIEVENVQIVNGLQTTNTIYQYFSNGGKDTQDRCVLVKVIVSTDNPTRYQIIQATNNQSSIPLYSLHATDKIQKDIEEIMYRNDLYYERKERYYQNLGFPNDLIFSPLYLASGYVALILKLPHRATKLKSNFMNNPTQYEKVFSENIDINIWPIIAIILRKVDKAAQTYKLNLKTSQENYARIVRPIISLISVSSILGKYSFGTNDLKAVNLDLLTEELLERIALDVINYINDSNIRVVKEIRKRSNMNSILFHFSEIYDINGFKEIEKRREFIYDEYEIDDDFLIDLQRILPDQPWPKGIHRTISEKLGCSSSKVYRAIDQLVQTGVFVRQRK